MEGQTHAPFPDFAEEPAAAGLSRLSALCLASSPSEEALYFFVPFGSAVEVGEVSAIRVDADTEGRGA